MGGGCERYEAYLYRFFNLCAICGWVVSHSQAVLLKGLRASTSCTGDQVGFEAGLEGYKKLFYNCILRLGLSSKCVYQLCYPGHL